MPTFNKLKITQNHTSIM